MNYFITPIPHFPSCGCQFCMAAIEEVNRLRFEHIAIDNTPTGPFPFEETPQSSDVAESRK